MKKYLISYDLGGPETRQDYARLIAHIKTYEFWAKPLKSVWIVVTHKSASEVREGIREFIDGNDKVMVIEVTRDWATYGISSEVSNWMNQSL